MTTDEPTRWGRRVLRFLRSPRRIALVSLSLVLLATLGWLLMQAGHRGVRAAPRTDDVAVGTPVKVDRPAPAFTQPLLSEHGSLSLSRYADRIVVLNFWASNCDACRSEGPALGRLAASFANQGVRVVGVDYEDSMGAGARFARAHGMRYPSVMDPHGTVGDAYRIFGLPMTFVIVPGQHIRYMVVGKIDVPSFRAVLESLLRATKA